MFFLDTDTIIYSLKGDEAVAAHLRRHMDDAISVCVITLMELYYGAYKSQNIAGNLAKIKSLEQGLEIIPVGTEAVEIFGMLKARFEKEGTRLDDFDLVIAACALTRNLTLVTNNIRHFGRIEGLKLANWKTQPG
jgi:tRNA(fMet)-specific endonuclease VapC